MAEDRNSKPRPEPSELERFLAAKQGARGVDGPSGPDIVVVKESAISALAAAVNRSGGWVKEQVHTGLQEAVSRFLGLDRTPEPEKEHEQDRDKGMER